MYQWRRFQFFEERSLSGPLPDELKDTLTCSTSGRGQISFGNEVGTIFLVERGFKTKFSFPAHQGRVVHVQQLKQRNVLVSIGEEDNSPHALTSTCLKLWDLDRFVEESSTVTTTVASGSSTSGALSRNGSAEPPSLQPVCIRSLKVFPAKFPEAQITCFAVLEEGPPVLLIALGLDSGFVYLIRGDVSRERVARIKLSVDPASGGKLASPVTALGFRVEGGNVHLFAVSAASVNAFNMSQQQTPQKHTLDLHGCLPHCCVISNSQELVVGRSEAVYFYDSDGRGPCWAFEGPKQRLAWFRNYLVCVAPDSRKGSNVLTVYDLKNKLVAHNEPVGGVGGGGEVAHLLSEWGMIVVILKGEGRAVCLGEKDMGSKLEMLFRKNLYPVAVNLVQAQDADATATAEVMRKYGDHLYSKQDYGEAMAQYVHTIGQLEPSYVIQKFLDTQRIHLLTAYLEALHGRGLAMADHTTLLLNCYTKLKDVAKLDEFIKGEHVGEGSQGSGASSQALAFDVSTVIKVCRSAGYFKHALYVAKRAGEHKDYIRILLEDLGHYEEALSYIRGLHPEEAALTMKQYGNILVKYRPQELTAVLLKLCAGVEYSAGGPRKQGAANGVMKKEEMPQGDAVGVQMGKEARRREGEGKLRSPLEFAHVYMDSPLWLMRFLEEYSLHRKDCPDQAAINNTLLELYLAEDLSAPVAPGHASIAFAMEGHGAQGTQVGNKGSDSGGLLVKEWEGKRVEERAPSSKVEGKAEYEPSADGRLQRQQRALKLLRSAWPQHEGHPTYDADMAVVLCQMQGFRQGLLLLYERLQLHKEIIACYMQDGDYKGLIACCKRLGDASRGGEPSLWGDVLSFFGSRQEDCSMEVQEVLEVLEKDALMPPLIVLQTLAKNPVLKLGLVKDYVGRQITRQSQLIEEDRKAIQKYQEETAAMKAEVHELKTSARIFQLSKCSACTYALDLPAVHFLCMHSFHQRCLGDENDCPICAVANRTVLEMKRNLEQSTNDHDTFFQLVQNSEDGFTVVADYFGRGILNKSGNSAGGANVGERLPKAAYAQLPTGSSQAPLA